LNGEPNCIDPAYPPKNGFPFPPLGQPWGFLLLTGKPKATSQQ
jgi:hypothetical protein